VLLGPYSTQLTRAAVRGLGERERLLWNHGGAGDDVQRLTPGRVVSVLTPAGRYAEPFLRRVARPPLRIVAGAGAFGRQVAAGAEALARELGMEFVVGAGSHPALTQREEGSWDLLSAGVFEDDVATVRRALALPRPPRTVWSVAAGVRDSGGPDGVYGPAQWFPGSGAPAQVGPQEAAFLGALGGDAPDYPAVQAAAAAALAVRCAELAGSIAPAAQWAAAAALDATTLFGRFRIDPATGAQVGHETVLVRWSAGAARRVP
jgi:hypothetical protein